MNDTLTQSATADVTIPDTMDAIVAMPQETIAWSRWRCRKSARRKS